MDIAWNEFKPLLRRAYFGESESSVAARDSEAARDFFLFFDKYLDVCRRKRIVSEKNRIGADSSKLAVGGYSKFLRKPYAVKLSGTAKYALREVPTHVVAEFDFVFGSWLEFCQKTKLKRLKKLREGQRSLPIAPYRQQIIDTVTKNNVVIIAGDTGCGKSTQVPQYLLSAGFTSSASDSGETTNGGRICCTQPRRIACIALSKRVAFETLGEYGTTIAYQIRFEKTCTSQTKMLFLTEGLLLRQLAADPLLEAYKIVILDEIHERHLQGDFLLGLLRELVGRRGDLKLILMSATINLDLFSAYFEGAPVVRVPGRLHPIRVHYMPPPVGGEKDKLKSAKIDPSPYMRILQMVDQKFPSSERGDMLIFLSGISEITTVAEALKVYAEQSSRWIILILHSTLSLEEQDKVFDIAPEGVRKCVLSTNIAETSVTIDGIRFVVDSGKVKQMRYDSESRMHQLKEIWVSQASAEQRKGRAGRTGPGISYRLYSSAQYDSFVEYTTSEIKRVSLESLALQMFSLELTGEDVESFPFIEPPNNSSFREAIEGLRDQEVLGGRPERGQQHLTALGKMLASLPVDIPIGKMLVMSCLFRQVEAALTLAAGLSVQSPFTNRSFRDLECLSARASLCSSHGDAFTLLNTYREWMQVKRDGGECSRRWCRRRGVEEQRLYEITKLRRQFKDLLEDGDLIDKTSLEDQAYGSAERRIRAGEMKRLRDLKRKARHEEKRRKVLKPDRHFDSIMQDMEQTMDEREIGSAGSSETDVHAVEFQMRHSSSELAQACHEHRLSHSIALVLKTITCSGLYPQYAVLDQHNAYKLGADLVAHSRTKPFVIVHPNSSVAQEPECLAVTTDKAGNSSNHQLLFYGLLLETTKPYLVNVVRVPALHSLLLFAKQVQTSRDFSRIVCDQMVEFGAVDLVEAEELVTQAQETRRQFRTCLERKFGGESYRSSSLAKLLADYYSIELVYNMRRLVAAADILSPIELDQEDAAGAVPSSISRFEIGALSSVGNPEGESASSYIAKKWQCSECGENFCSTSRERREHIRCCKVNCGAREAAEDERSEQRRDANPLKRSFYCDVCRQQLSLTPVEILKHRRSHK